MTWFTIEIIVLRRPCHEDLRIEKWRVQHPSSAGFYYSIGEERGQKADYRKCLDDGRCLHVKEFQNYYLVHWDHVDPFNNPIGHLIVDAPHWLLFVILAIGVFSLLLHE